MTDTAGFTVADLRSRAGEEAFRAAGEHVVAIDGPDEDEWSLSATIRLDDGRTLETILHHRVGGPLDGECDCPPGTGRELLLPLGLGRPGPPWRRRTCGGRAGRGDRAHGDLRPWLATLRQGELIELVLEAADADRDYRRRLDLRSRTQSSQP
jgi:hypothetical protein